jgi:hypothetical protein
MTCEIEGQTDRLPQTSNSVKPSLTVTSKSNH